VTLYEITFASSAKREFRDLTPDVIERIRPRIRELATARDLRDARSFTAIKTVGESGLVITGSSTRSTMPGELSTRRALPTGARCTTDDCNCGGRSPGYSLVPQVRVRRFDPNAGRGRIGLATRRLANGRVL